MTKIYFDENLSPYLARGLHLLHQPLQSKTPVEILSLQDVFGKGIKDEEWIPKLGEEKAVIITQDMRIFKVRSQRDLFHAYGVGVFFFHPPSKSGYSYWDLVKSVINRWEEIKKIALKETPPFAYRYSSRSTKAERW
jgi:hypothetical protein